MTIKEYMNVKTFPLTTQEGLDPKNQLFLDASRYDMAQELIGSGAKLNDKQQKVLAELEKKMKHNARLAGELAKEARAKKEAK